MHGIRLNEKEGRKYLRERQKQSGRKGLGCRSPHAAPRGITPQVHPGFRVLVPLPVPDLPAGASMQWGGGDVPASSSGSDDRSVATSMVRPPIPPFPLRTTATAPSGVIHPSILPVQTPDSKHSQNSARYIPSLKPQTSQLARKSWYSGTVVLVSTVISLLYLVWSVLRDVCVRIGIHPSSDHNSSLLYRHRHRHR